MPKYCYIVLYEECFHFNPIEKYLQPKEFSTSYNIWNKDQILYDYLKMQIKNKFSGIIVGLALNHSLNLIQLDPRKLRKTLLISWFILPSS